MSKNTYKMNYFVVLLFICCFPSLQCRPSGMENNSDLEENEYNSDPVVEEENQEDEETSVEEQESTDQDKLRQQIMSEDQFHVQLAENSRPSHTDLENDIFNKLDFIESRERSSNRQKPFNINSQAIEYHDDQNFNSNNEVFLNRNKKKDEHVYDDSVNYAMKPNEAVRQEHYFNHYYDESSSNDNKISNTHENFNLLGYNRDTRSLKDDNTSDTTRDNSNANENCKEYEQTVIKEHLRKLSDNDLRELLSSLTEEKKELLQKLIEDNSTTDNISKREVTKITIEDESGSQTESDKNLGVSNKLENVDTSSDNTMTTQNSHDIKYIEKNGAVETSNQQPLTYRITDSVNQDDLLNKDTKIDDLPITIDKEAGDGKLLQNPEISDYEDELDNLQNRKDYKREIQTDEDIALSQSLEDSFPNSNVDENPLLYSEPLIRVKRREPNKTLKKRAAGVLSDSKMGYFSYKADNQDEDNNEGNEFDDESFFDSLESVNNNEGQDYLDLKKGSNNCNKKGQSRDLIKENNSNFDVQKETENVGSDTDLILSGIETIDDKLMYNGNSRGRRQVLEQAETHPDKDKQAIDDDKIESTSEKYMNSPGYHEDDAFGPLPHNSIGDLGRYKRIRRVKQSHKDENVFCKV